MTYEIEKGVPLPIGATKYPFREMQIGGSFFVPSDGEPLARVRRRLSVSAHSFTRRCEASRAFTVRRVDGGIRVWRVK